MLSLPAINTADKIWFKIFGHVPTREMRFQFDPKCILSNTGGFPALTPLGDVVKAKVIKAKDYFMTYPEFFG